MLNTQHRFLSSILNSQTFFQRKFDDGRRQSRRQQRATTPQSSAAKVEPIHSYYNYNMERKLQFYSTLQSQEMQPGPDHNGGSKGTSTFFFRAPLELGIDILHNKLVFNAFRKSYISFLDEFGRFFGRKFIGEVIFAPNRKCRLLLLKRTLDSVADYQYLKLSPLC